MADRVAVLESGRLRQVDTPSALYQRPVDAFVADFIGNVHTFTTTHIEFKESTVVAETSELGKLRLPLASLPNKINAGTQSDKPAVIAFRPESVTVELAPENSTINNKYNVLNNNTNNVTTDNTLVLEGLLGDIAFQGQYSIVEVTRGQQQSITAVVDSTALATLQRQPLGTKVIARCAYENLMLLPAS